MKTLISLFTVFLMLVSTSSCGQAQNDDNQIIAMLKDFYTAYNKAWESDIKPDILIKELNSLQQKYCTDSLRNELKKQFQIEGLDHDPLINDLYSDVESLKTLSITKDTTKTNAYIVSYFANTFDPRNKPIKEKVTIHLTVMKEKGSYKINDVW